MGSSMGTFLGAPSSSLTSKPNKLQPSEGICQRAWLSPQQASLCSSKGCRGGQRHRSSSRRDPAPGSCCGETEAKTVQVSAPPRARPRSAFLCSPWPTTWLITYCFVTKSLKWYLREITDQLWLLEVFCLQRGLPLMALGKMTTGKVEAYVQCY